MQLKAMEIIDNEQRESVYRMTINPDYDLQCKSKAHKDANKAFDEVIDLWLDRLSVPLNSPRSSVEYKKENVGIGTPNPNYRAQRMSEELGRQSKEQDPSGLKPSDPGAKLDNGKPDLDLVLGDFSRALEEVGKVGTFGAAKYSKSGWLEVPNAISRYSSALLRHFFSGKNEERDRDSNLLHLSHLAWNALAILELTLRKQNENEEPTNKFTEGTSKQG